MTNEVQLDGIGLTQMIRPVPPFDTSTPPTDGQALVWDATAGKYKPGAITIGIPGAVGDGVADDTTALVSAISAARAGSAIDLAGCTYKTSSVLTINKALRLVNGTITAGAHNALSITASGVALGPNLTVSRSASYGATDAISARATVRASAPFIADGVNIPAAAHSCFYLSHAQCNGSLIRGGALTPSVAAQDAAGVYVAAGGTGNLDIVIENVTVPSGTQGIIVFDAKRCTVRGCRVSNMAVLPTVTVSGWSVVSGNVYRCRTASGTPGSTGPSTDRTDGNTRVVKQSGTVLNENTATPTTPGASQWGISGGYLYIDLGGTNPSTVTITSDIVSGYGITCYSTSNGFTDMSENLVAHNYVTNVDGFGIYMQIANYALTCVNNKTIGNTLKSVCLKGSQDGHLPFAGLAWNGGINCRSIGDTIDTPGATSFTAPGFFASDGSVACRGAAIGVVVTNSLTEGFKLTCANWTYSDCSADANVAGFRAIFPNIGGLVRNIQLIGCRATGNTQQGVYLDGSTTGANASATIIGGTFHDNGQQGIQITTMRHTMVVGASLSQNGVTSFHQVRFSGDCLYSGFEGLILAHGLAGLSISVAAQTTEFHWGSAQIPSNMAAAVGSGNTYRIAGGAGTVAEFSGTGAPSIGGKQGDHYWRYDTPTTANQRLYICTVAGAAGAATWVGVL
jgi:hypothetical protein